ncbi:energy transducer TonB [Quatrionicoccus australiensis]|uniref:energy transducer TonB n=1 Tax=Quatrionicoccus australiensis TaxID=138118 RepID=UPI001CF8B5B4|nr:energy transducer TonB [Quatrionicoccus australiensis]UCV14293.1 energy transducer TonB [Quatrionicoccus australiensis]
MSSNKSRTVSPVLGFPSGFEHFPAVDRKLLAILLASLALHAGLLAWTQAPRRPLAFELPPIVASLRPMAATPSGAAPGALPQEVRQPAPRPQPKAAARVLVAAGPADPVRVPAPPVAPAAVPVAAAPVVPAAASARPAAENAVLPASTAAAAPAQADLLAAYRRQLAELFARHQEYPRVAALRGWEGEVRLRLTVARKGNLLHIEVERSSGYGILDQHALAMVGELSGLPALPAALEGNEIQVLVPVNYKLKKTT